MNKCKINPPSYIALADPRDKMFEIGLRWARRGGIAMRTDGFSKHMRNPWMTFMMADGVLEDRPSGVHAARDIVKVLGVTVFVCIWSDPGERLIH